MALLRSSTLFINYLSELIHAYNDVATIADRAAATYAHRRDRKETS